MQIQRQAIGRQELVVGPQELPDQQQEEPGQVIELGQRGGGAEQAEEQVEAPAAAPGEQERRYPTRERRANTRLRYFEVYGLQGGGEKNRRQ